MPNPVTEIAEFYHQLALLVRANMPLPESLLQIGHQFTRRAFRDVVVTIGERAEQGEPFADLLQEYPQYFSPFHVQLLRLGERSGTLPEMLHTVARFARFQQLMGTTLRDALAYPLLVAHVACIGLLIVCLLLAPSLQEFLHSLPEMSASLYDFNDGPRESLPWYTTFVFAATGVIASHRTIVLGLYAAFVLYSLWLFLPGRASHRSVLRLIERLPGSWRIAHSVTSSRICSMWGVFIQQGVPTQDALELAAQLADHPRTIAALTRAAEEVRDGADVAVALSHQPAIDRLITLVFRHSPENQLADELATLGELFDQRVALASRAVARIWTFWAFIVVSFLVGGVAVATFLPLYGILRLTMVFTHI